MKLSAFFLLAFCLHVSAGGFSQSVTVKAKDASLLSVLKTIKKQTSFTFIVKQELLQKARKVTLDLVNAPIAKVLDACFKDQPLQYYLDGNVIVIKPVEPAVVAPSERQPDKTINNFLSPPITVQGRIVNEKGEPVAASILVRGTKNGANTNEEGYFRLTNVDEKATLVISGVSIETQNFRIPDGSNSSNIDLGVIKIKTRVAEEEELVVAYNKTTIQKNVSAVTVVKGEQIQNLPNRSFDRSLQGLVPGLLVTSGTGTPGGGLANFVLRGIATGGSVTNAESVRNPLIVIDGVPVFQDPAQVEASSETPYGNPMAQLNPGDIESITVLKDAAAISLYGSKASNGVILITTKRGKAGKTIFNFRHQTDIAGALNGKVKMLSQEEYLELLYEAYKNTDAIYWTDARIKSDLISKFPYKVNAPGDTSFYPASNWMSELFRDRAATFSNQLSMSGGNERSDFFLNIEYTKQNGVAIGTGFDRKSLRFNFENRPATWLKLGMNTTLSYSIQDYGSSGDYSTAFRISPLNTIRKADGKYVLNYNWGLTNSAGYSLANPVAAANLNINRNTAFRGITKLYAEVKIFKCLTLSSSVGGDFMLTEAREKKDRTLGFVDLDPGIGRIRERDVRNANMITTNIVRFDKNIHHDHSINVLLGQEAQILTNRYLHVTRENFANSVLDQINQGSVTKTTGGQSAKQTLLSYFGQLNYAFRNKYLLSGSFRRDGSSRFGENERFGTYGSVGAGWVITEEPFMKSIAHYLNYAKLRGSIGIAGNSAAISGALRYDVLNQTSFLNNVAVYPNTFLSFPGNPGIQWEQTFTWDAGLELRALKERMSFTADVYVRKTSNLIADVNIPTTTGFSTLRDNIGDMKNQGVELALSVDIIRNKNFRWNVNVNWSKNQNILVRSFKSLELISGNKMANGQGKNYNSFYLVKWAGVNPADGRPQWVDSTGKPSSDYKAAKREFVGKPQPDGFGAVTNTIGYMGFEMSAMLYYQYGFQMYNDAAATMINDGGDPYINQSRAALDRWQKPGDMAANPRRYLNNRNTSLTPPVSENGTSTSTRYLMDGDFIRFSNISLSYSVPKKLISRLSINTLKVFVQAHNIATWTKYSGQDPESMDPSGLGTFTFPQQRTYTVGVNLSF